MINVGDFCTLGRASDLLVVEGVWKQRGEVVRLCRLSDGLQLALPEARLTPSTDPAVSFRKHITRIVRAHRKESNAIGALEYGSNAASEFAQYVEITKREAATYRVKSITYFIILLESRYLGPSYSMMQVWRDVCSKCDLLDIDSPTLGFIKTRMHKAHDASRANLTAL